MMYKKRILAGALGCIMTCTEPAGIFSAAQLPQAAAGSALMQINKGQEKEAQAETAAGAEEAGSLPVLPEDLKPDYNDPDYVKQLFLQEDNTGDEAPYSIRSGTAFTTKSPFTGLSYTHAARLSGSSITHGIDVSKWQAQIDWKKVKAAGVDFVFIRCGYTSLSKTFAMHEDEYFKSNIQNAYNAGIKVGIYFFSNSITESEAKKEAQKTLELIAAYKKMITLPVVYDFEAFSSSYRAYGITKAQATKNMLAYMKVIENAGYTPMYYSNPSFLSSMFDVSQLTAYDCWLANYTTKTSYTGDYIYWQYSSTGQVNGITGSVDCNFYYSGADKDTPSQPQDPGISEPPDVVESLGPAARLTMTDHAMDSITIAWEPVEAADGYIVYRGKSYGGTYKQMKVISGSSNTEYTDNTVIKSEGRQYYYQVVPYIMEEGERKSGRVSDILTAYTKREHTFRLKTTTNLNLRTQAGTEYPSLIVVPSGSAFTYFKFTLSSLDKKWYKVTYAKNGKSYTGYLSGSYVSLYTYGKTTKNVNMRSGAGLTNKITRVIPTGTRVTIVSKTTDKLGIQWSHVKYTYKGKGYSGYIPTKYIRQI